MEPLGAFSVGTLRQACWTCGFLGPALPLPDPELLSPWRWKNWWPQHAWVCTHRLAQRSSVSLAWARGIIWISGCVWENSPEPRQRDKSTEAGAWSSILACGLGPGKARQCGMGQALKSFLVTQAFL